MARGRGKIPRIDEWPTLCVYSCTRHEYTIANTISLSLSLLPEARDSIHFHDSDEGIFQILYGAQIGIISHRSVPFSAPLS